MEYRRCNTLRCASAIIFAFVLTQGLTLRLIWASEILFYQSTHFEAHFIDEGKMKKSRAMDSKSLVDSMLGFLSKEFQVEEAEQLWGEIDIKTNPNNLFLRPKYDWVERASLGFVDENGEKFFSSIFIDLKESTPIDMGKLIAAFKEPNSIPRLKPSEPFSYLFEVKGKDFSGNLLIGLEAEKGSIRSLKYFRFLRYPLSWH